MEANVIHDHAAPAAPVELETHPSRYRHWKLSIEGELARLTMAVQADQPLRAGYELKLNSYDLGVDIELADAVQRLRFAHPDVRTVILTGDKDKVFCAGANIHMLGSSTHAFKVNFCKFTNETRLAIEDASRHSGQRWLAACNGTTAGGGYELAMACDEIVLIDDGSSAVSLPEVSLLAVLPGTGGLTRLTDKRKVRRDLADVFSTLAEGVKGKRAVDWRLVDAVVARSKWNDTVTARAKALAAKSPAPAGARGIRLDPLEPRVAPHLVKYQHVTLELDNKARVATITIAAPTGHQPATADDRAGGGRGADGRCAPSASSTTRCCGCASTTKRSAWCCSRRSATRRRCWRPTAASTPRRARATGWRARSCCTWRACCGASTSRRAASSRSIEPGSCFAGSLLELALAADRILRARRPGAPAHLGDRRH